MNTSQVVFFLELELEYEYIIYCKLEKGKRKKEEGRGKDYIVNWRVKDYHMSKVAAKSQFCKWAFYSR